MNLSEKDARTKWCTMIKARQAGSLAGWECCIASDCMMWRWQPLLADDAFKEAVKKRREQTGDKGSSQHKAVEYVKANRAEYGLPTEPYLGYCGLAGVPEK